MNTILLIFVRAIFIYLAITIPSLFFAIMYFYSAMFALAVCWIAGLIFLLGYLLLSQLKLSVIVKYYSLFIFIVLGVWIAFEFIEIFKLWDHIWSEKQYLLFPLAALLSGCISLIGSRKEVISQFKNEINEFEVIKNW